MTQDSSFKLCNSVHTRSVCLNVTWYLLNRNYYLMTIICFNGSSSWSQRMDWKWFTHPLLFPRSQQGADKWITLAFTQMLTFRQGHEKGERQSDRVAASESFCSPRILCLWRSVLLRANITARERMAHLSRLFTCWVYVSGCHRCPLPPLPGLTLGMGQPVRVWMLVKQTNITQSCFLTAVFNIWWKTTNSRSLFRH